MFHPEIFLPLTFCQRSGVFTQFPFGKFIKNLHATRRFNVRFQIQRRISHRELHGVSKNMRPPVVCLRIFSFGGTVPFTICLFLQFVLFIYNCSVFRSLSVCSKICSCLPDCFVRRCTFVVFAVPSCVRRGLHRIFLAKCEKIL